jgi:hypothetical protein
MTTKLLRLGTFASGIIIANAAYSASQSITANAAPENSTPAFVLAVVVGLLGMAGGSAMICYSIFTEEDEL